MASPNTKKTDDIEENELYSTPIEAMLALEEDWLPEMVGRVFYDPCDGLGDISDFLETLWGIKVYRSDIKKYRDCENWLGEKDFLTLTKEDIPSDVTDLIFNPPFKLTEEFVDKAHELGLRLTMFNRLTTLESNGRAKKFVNDWHLMYVSVFGYRVSCTRGVEREPTANAVSYAWYLFDPKFDFEPRVGWFTK